MQIVKGIAQYTCPLFQVAPNDMLIVSYRKITYGILTEHNFVATLS
ncbi:MAG: hypothetical protein KatS3mg107_1175 [Gemmataceae bacterium]|nr:MAG: hypothetical protein KatS3mg107_1175 [Gemmataceae bacterium]